MTTFGPSLKATGALLYRKKLWSLFAQVQGVGLQVPGDSSQDGSARRTLGRGGGGGARPAERRESKHSSLNDLTNLSAYAFRFGASPEVQRRERLGGLLNYYHREAA